MNGSFECACLFYKLGALEYLLHSEASRIEKNKQLSTGGLFLRGETESYYIFVHDQKLKKAALLDALQAQKCLPY